jgi:hypothetical protein
LRAGDRVFVPVHRDPMRGLGAVYMVTSIALMFVTISSISH